MSDLTSDVPTALRDVRDRARVRRWMHAESVRIVHDIQTRDGTHASVIAGEAIKKLIDVCCRIETPNLVSEAQALDAPGEPWMEEERRRGRPRL